MASASRAVSNAANAVGRTQPAPAASQLRPPVDPATTPAAAAGLGTPPAPLADKSEYQQQWPLADEDEYRWKWRADPAASAAAQPIDPAVTPAAVEGNPTFNRYVRDPVETITQAAAYPSMAAGAAYAAGKPLSYVPKIAPLGHALLQGGARLSAATAPYTTPILGAGGMRTALPAFPLAAAAVPFVDGAFKLNQMLQDPDGGEARLQQSLQRYGNASPLGYAANVGSDATMNALSLLSGNGTPLAEMGEAAIGAFGPKALVDGEYEASRGRELDAELKSRQAGNEQATNQAMQTGSATQQQLRDASVYAQRQREADMQSRNWQPWLWGMSQ
jgi:hypothetical protein